MVLNTCILEIFQGEPFSGREAIAPSVIKEVEKVQGGGAGATKWQPRPPQRRGREAIQP